MTEFSNRVKELMASKKLSQKDLSLLSGVTEPSLCRYLKGQEPRMDIVNNVAKALGVNPDFLLGDGQIIAADPFVETRNIVARNKGQLTNAQKAELIDLLFEKSK